MNNFLKQLHAAFGQTRLSQQKKDEIRNNLTRFMHEHPVQPRKTFSIFRPRLFAFVVLVVVFITAGTGTVYASQSAKPGELLFPVRVFVAEPVAVALTFDQEQKADLELVQAEARITEQEQLVVLGDTAAATKHQKLVDDTVAKLQSRIVKLEARGESDKALDVASRAEAVMSVHTRISGLEKENDDSTEERETRTEQKYNEEDPNTEAIAKTRGAIESLIKNGDQNEQQARAGRRLDQTKSLIAGVREILHNKNDTLKEQVRIKAEEELQAADEEYASAKQKYDEGAHTESIIMSASASAKAQKVKTLLSVASQGSATWLQNKKDEDTDDGSDSETKKKESDRRLKERLHRIFERKDSDDNNRRDQ